MWRSNDLGYCHASTARRAAALCVRRVCWMRPAASIVEEMHEGDGEPDRWTVGSKVEEIKVKKVERDMYRAIRLSRKSRRSRS